MSSLTKNRPIAQATVYHNRKKYPVHVSLEQLPFESDYNPHTFLVSDPIQELPGLRRLIEFQSFLPGSVFYLPTLEGGTPRLFSVDYRQFTLSDLDGACIPSGSLFWVPQHEDFRTLMRLATELRQGTLRVTSEGMYVVQTIFGEIKVFQTEAEALRFLSSKRTPVGNLLDDFSSAPHRHTLALAMKYTMSLFAFRMQQFEEESVFVVEVCVEGEEMEYETLGPFWTLRDAKNAYGELVDDPVW